MLFLVFGIALVSAALFTAFFKNEIGPGRENSEGGEEWEPNSAREVVRAMWVITKNPNIRKYTKVLLANRVGVMFVDTIHELYLTDRGFPIRSFALLKMLQLPA